MILQLKAKHFKNTNYDDIESCAVAKALKETMPQKQTSSGATHVTIGLDTYNLVPAYLSLTFKEDQQKARQLVFDETIIREIEIAEL